MSAHAGLHHHAAESGGRPREFGRGLRTALIITAGVMVIEFVGGLLSNSLALVADAGHMLTDTAALGLSYFALWFASRPATSQKTFGFYRVEILAALLNGVLLVVVALWVFREAWVRFQAPPAVQADLMLMVASGGLLANLASAYVLYRSQSESLNVRGAFFHVLSDTVGSVGAILASLSIMFLGWREADAAISAVVALLILSSSWILIRDAVDILLEGVPSHINLTQLKNQLVGASGVRSVHDLHVWTLTSGVVAMSCHVVVEGGAVQSEILARVCGIAEKGFSIGHTTIQIEQEGAGEKNVSCDCPFGAH